MLVIGILSFVFRVLFVHPILLQCSLKFRNLPLLGGNNFDIDILLSFWLNQNLDPNLYRSIQTSQVGYCLSSTYPSSFTDKVIFKSTLNFWMIAVSHFISLPDWLDLVGHNCTYYFNTLQFGHFLWEILHSCLQYFITVLSQTLWRTHFSQN